MRDLVLPGLGPTAASRLHRPGPGRRGVAAGPGPAGCCSPEGSTPAHDRHPAGRHRDQATEIALADQAAQNTLMQTVSTRGQRRRPPSTSSCARPATWSCCTTTGSGLAPSSWPTTTCSPSTSTRRSAAEDRAAPGSWPRPSWPWPGRCSRSATAVWDDARLTIAFPVLLKDEVWAVLTITSGPPFYRHDDDRADGRARRSSRWAGSPGASGPRGARRGPRPGDGGVAAEVGVPGHDEPRDPHPAQRGHRPQRPADAAPRSTSEQQRLAAGVQVASRALLGVINDILDFSKIEAGRLELEVLDFEVRPVLDQVVGVLAGTARAKGVELSLSCAADVPRVVAGDPTRIAQVLTNLVSNAVKFTEQRPGRRRGAPPRPRPRRRRHPGRLRDRHRHRHAPREGRRALRPLHPGRCLDHPRVRRHRAGAGDLARDRPGPGRALEPPCPTRPGGAVFTVRDPAGAARR